MHHRGAVPAEDPVARERDHRNAHQQRFAGRQSAIPGESVQADVDVAVLLERFAVVRAPPELDAPGVDAGCDEVAQDIVPHLGLVEVASLQHQARARHAPQHTLK